MVAQRLKQFVVENFYIADASQIDEDTSLIQEGLVDSTGMLEVMAFVENEFGITIADTDMTPENFETIGRIARFVHSKQGTSAGADPALAA